MKKSRVFELSKSVNMDPKVVLAFLKENGFHVANIFSRVGEPETAAAREYARCLAEERKKAFEEGKAVQAEGPEAKAVRVKNPNVFFVVRVKEEDNSAPYELDKSICISVLGMFQTYEEAEDFVCDDTLEEGSEDVILRPGDEISRNYRYVE